MLIFYAVEDACGLDWHLLVVDHGLKSFVLATCDHFLEVDGYIDLYLVGVIVTQLGLLEYYVESDQRWW
jgi:hypothetical protein